MENETNQTPALKMEKHMMFSQDYLVSFSSRSRSSLVPLPLLDAVHRFPGLLLLSGSCVAVHTQL